MPFFYGISMFWIFFILCLQLRNIGSLSEDIKVFSADNDTPLFNHLTTRTGLLKNKYMYIGAVNRLYVLSPDLKLLVNFSTGPISGSNTFNKILITDDFYFGDIFTCTSSTIYKCNTYKIISENDNVRLENQKERIFGNVINHNVNVSTVAFVPISFPIEIFFGTSYNSDFPNQPNLAIKNPQSDELPSGYLRDKILYDTDNTFNSDIVKTKYRDAYMVNYIYGFGKTFQKYSYFLTTQKKSIQKESPLVSKMIRLCVNNSVESEWQGYTQIPIECKDNDGFTYNEVRAAYAEDPRSYPSGDVLGLFCNNENIKATSTKPRDRCALCIYSLKAINEKFDENIRNCANGNGNRGFETIIPYANQTCIKENIANNSNFCSSKLNMPLDGNIPVVASPIITFDTLVTAVISSKTTSYSWVFVGTQTGHLKKINLKDEDSACEYDDLEIDEGSPVNSDLIISPKPEDYLYIMTKTKLTRILTKLDPLNCSLHKNYNTCIHTAPKQCGWCLIKNECTTRCDCSYNKSSTWYPYNLLEYVGNITDGSNNFQIGSIDMLQVSIKHLSPITDGITCKFTIHDLVLQTIGFLFDDKIELHKVLCPIPKEIGSLQLKSSDRTNINTALSIQIGSEIIEDNVMQNIQFFDCEIFTTMESCVVPTYQCQWFFEEKKCMFKKSNIQKDALVITFPKDSGLSILKFIIYGILIILGIGLILVLIYFILKRREKKNQVDLGAQQKEMEFMVR